MPGDSGPHFVPPMLATPAKSWPPKLDEWVVEPKLDGMRAIVSVFRGHVRAWSRTGRDITRSFPELGTIGEYSGRRTLVLDGELVVMDGPRADFRLLQRRMFVARPSVRLTAAIPVTLAVFDLLQVGARSVQRNPYEQRRALLGGLNLGPGVLVVPAFPGVDAQTVFDAAAAQGLEGVILKRRGSRYASGRSRDWAKIKIPGYRRPLARP